MNYRTLLSLALVLVLLAACGGASAPQGTPANEPASATDGTPPPATEATEGGEAPEEQENGDLREITVAFPYIPNVQFAPYYVAASKGYYTDKGLDVTFSYMYENEAVQLVAQEEAEFGFLSGISILLARQQGLPVMTVATITHEFPVVFLSKGGQSLETPQDLQDKQIGIPGRFGASYYGLLAVLYASDMQEQDLNIQDVGFNQVELLLQDNIDVAVGYAMNEPVQLRDMGEEVEVLRVADVFPLISDGIITHQRLVAEEPELIQSFVNATLHGVRDTLQDPDEAFTLSLEHIPEAEGTTEQQRTVLQETLPYWQSDQPGHSDLAVWEQTHTFLRASGILADDVPLEESVTNQFVAE